MRRLLNISVTCVTILALGALLAGSAGATNAISVIQESTGKACPAVTSGTTGGCLLHSEGEATLFMHLFGFESMEAKCHIEASGRTDGVGSGYVNSVVMSEGAHGDSNCAQIAPPCSGSLPWTGNSEEDAGNLTVAHIDMCIDPLEGSDPCQGEFVFPVAETGTTPNEVQHFTAVDQRLGSSLCEDTFDMETEVDGVNERVRIATN